MLTGCGEAGRRAWWGMLLGAALLMVGPFTSVHATTLAHADLASMARDADAVVHAIVERAGTQMAYNASTSSWSVAELRVLRWLSVGQAERIWIRDPGAVWKNGGLSVAGAARYKLGEEVIVFLREDAGKYFRTHNLAAGKLTVRRAGPDTMPDAMVEQDLRQVSVIAAGDGTIATGERHRLGPLRGVLTRLEHLLGQGR